MTHESVRSILLTEFGDDEGCFTYKQEVGKFT